jgi:predicted PurR-regulated permease PerM
MPTRALTWAIFIAAAVIVAALCMAMLHPFAHVIAWAATLAILSIPLQQKLVERTGRVAVSALITSVVAVLVCVVPLLLLGAVAVNECIGLARRLQLSPIAWPADLGGPAVTTWIEQHVSDVVHGAGTYTFTIANGLFDAVLSSVLVIFAMFLLLRDGKGFVEAIPDFLPFERRRSEALIGRIKDVVLASVYGVVTIALLQGVLCGAMFWMLEIPAAALWGAVTVFASLLPVVGAFAVWGPGVAYLALTGALPRAVVLAIWGTVVVSGIDNVLRPRLVASRVGLSELAMFFALLGGLSVFGALGVVLGPVVFATAAAMVETLRQPAVAIPFGGRRS